MFAVSLDQITSVAGPPVDVHVIVWVVLSYSNDMIATCPACIIYTYFVNPLRI